jgi:hypothetical protein
MGWALKRTHPDTGGMQGPLLRGHSTKAFSLQYFEDWDVEELGDNLGSSPAPEKGAVRKLVPCTHILGRLRKVFDVQSGTTKAQVYGWLPREDDTIVVVAPDRPATAAVKRPDTEIDERE